MLIFIEAIYLIFPAKNDYEEEKLCSLYFLHLLLGYIELWQSSQISPRGYLSLNIRLPWFLCNFLFIFSIISFNYFVWFYFQRLLRNRNDPDCHVDYGIFCLMIDDFQKVGWYYLSFKKKWISNFVHYIHTMYYWKEKFLRKVKICSCYYS